MIELIHGDCLEEMKNIESQSIDMVMTDPPYGTTACKWDSIIDLELMWTQLKRIIKPKGAIVLTATQPFASMLITSNIKMFKYDCVWNKTRATDFIRAKLKYMGGHESVLIFSHASVANGAESNMNYYPQGLIKINKVVNNGGGGIGFLGRNKENLGNNNKLHEPTYHQEYTGYPNTKLNFDSVINTVHPTQKPVSLMKHLIETFTKKDELVLDFTMGSGTTGVSCNVVQRNFIGIEKDRSMFEIAENRINESMLNYTSDTTSNNKIQYSLF